MLRERGWIVVLLGCMSIGIVCGCGRGKGMQMSGVDGIVTFKGAPLPNHIVKFVGPTGTMAVGKTNDEGKFEIAGGVPVGKCKVLVTATGEAMNFDGIDAAAMAKPKNAQEANEVQQAMRKMSKERKEKRGQEKQEAKQKKEGIPARYGTPTGGLEATVKANRAENKFNFDISE